jgi:hypothetical protein
MNEPRRRPGRRPQRDARRLVKEGLLPQADLFERIFEWDATIVDIDLSIWDKQIAIYVRPHHGGLYFVEFLRVRSLNIEFNHHEFDFNEKFGPDEHIHWVINRFDVQQVEHGLAISCRWKCQIDSFPIGENRGAVSSAQAWPRCHAGDCTEPT